MRKVEIDYDYILTFRLIHHKIRCAKQALNLKIIPHDAPEEVIERYMRVVLGMLSGHEFLLEDWFNRMKAIYNIPQGAHIQFSDRNTYLEVWEEGEERPECTGGCNGHGCSV